jgi:hypothetical protein
MDHIVYATMKRAIQHKLEMLYVRTAIPPDAPGKQDFGDIDFVVEGQIDPITPKEVAKALGAVRYVDDGSHTAGYAIPHPTLPNAYIQVDVEEISWEVWDWVLFCKAYSDFRQILGVIHRNLGLTINDVGLHLRIPEIEPSNKKRSLVLLSSDPSEVLCFLGLDYYRFEEGFENEDAMFDWIARCRFFDREALAHRATHQDRRRLDQRPMYRRFFSDWLPAHPQAGTRQKPCDRDKVRELALFHFGKRDEYAKKLTDFIVEQREARLWKIVADHIRADAEGKTKRAVKGFKIWARLEDGRLEFRDEPDIEAEKGETWATAICRDDALFGPDYEILTDSVEVSTALEWMEWNWEKAYELEKARSSGEKGA